MTYLLQLERWFDIGNSALNVSLQGRNVYQLPYWACH